MCLAYPAFGVTDKEYFYDGMIDWCGRGDSAQREPKRSGWAQLAIQNICNENDHGKSWRGVLPHVLVKQLLVDRRKIIHTWGAALVTNGNGEDETAKAVRAACLPPLMELLESPPEQASVLFAPHHTGSNMPRFVMQYTILKVQFSIYDLVRKN